jgi:hypothetical protein
VTVGTLEKTKQTLIQAIAKVEAGIKVQEDRIKAGYIEKEVTTIIKGAFTTYKELKEARVSDHFGKMVPTFINSVQERTTKILEDAKKAIDESLNDAEEMLALAVLNHVDDYNTTVAKLGGSQLALTEGFKKVEVQIEED